ncbi:hypothetical protein HOY34_20595 [Xinfangfangia sp. D13-10-4-6]|uniref:hypothetical protein n=1 Tax=Pseudogemmobacter hezensis TaxID=2737662 RepID=UPI001556B3FF|nr:hypothetical protein [Pseudogemmobacter hezensis]NPD17588.1 hypothetical protein [Pseudogemmobacter hezensis]
MLIANKPFPFSRDGVTLEHAVEGKPVDLPEALIAGLEAEGYVTKASGGTPENKADPFSREAIEALSDKTEIVDLLEVHGADADKRKSVETLRAELLAVMFVSTPEG